MDKWQFTIKSKKQDNGLWGFPFQLKKIRDFRFLDTEKYLLVSAICMGIAERYPDDDFEIFGFTDDGFFVKLDNNGFKNIRFNNYKLLDSTLIWVGPKC